MKQDSVNDWGYLYVMGGDSFVKTTDEEAGERGGGYTNDVWVTEGSGWKIYNEGNKPMIKSTMQWNEVNPGRLPPAGLTYEDWIVCQVRQRERERGVEREKQLEELVGGGGDLERDKESKETEQCTGVYFLTTTIVDIGPNHGNVLSFPPPISPMNTTVCPT